MLGAQRGWYSTVANGDASQISMLPAGQLSSYFISLLLLLEANLGKIKQSMSPLRMSLYCMSPALLDLDIESDVYKLGPFLSIGTARFWLSSDESIQATSF